MDDEIIVENMKAVLKSTKKKKAVTNHNNKGRVQNDSDSKDDDIISDLMSKNWQMKSPIDRRNGKTTEHSQSGKQLTNAFEKMMNATRKVASGSPPSQKSDTSPSAINGSGSGGGSKKRTYQRKRKVKKTDAEKFFETESDMSVLDEESLHETSFFKSIKSRAKKSPMPVIAAPTNDDHKKPLEQIFATDELTARKRNRTSDNDNHQPQQQPQQQQLEKPVKRRKVREVLLDSNENSLSSSPQANDAVVKEEEERHGSGRPKRSCSNRIDYSVLLDSPEKSPKRSRKQNHKPKYDADDNSLEIMEIDENSPIKKQQQQRAKNPVKLAPLFVRKVPKPSVDPSIIEARRNFLLSELPASLRAPIDKQRQIEDEILSNNLIAYPLIAHVMQNELFSFPIDYNDGKKLYSESKIGIKAAVDDDEEMHEAQKILKHGAMCDYNENKEASITLELVENIKASVRAIKDKCENFPTNRCFKQVLSKVKSARSNDSGVESVSLSYQHSLFIDIFKPMGFEEYLIGAEPVKRLQEFLTTWNERNVRDYDSEDDESCSRQSSRGSNNFVVLSGKHGSGKSSSVYALANDLNYEVIEINAGSKRNGKKILQDLLEATQSHRVEKHLVEDEDSQSGGCSGGGSSNDADKRTIILIEDAELSFENDDGFMSSIQQLINISKRPVILTTNDRSCQHLQKFLQYNEIIYDNPKSYVTKYLALMSLATSNYKIYDAEIEQLYALNRYDLRKTINEIEFFIRSDSARINGGSLMGLYGNNSAKKLPNEPKRNRKGQLAFYGKQQQQQREGEDLITLRFESSIMSSQCSELMASWHTQQQRRSSRGDEISYHQHNFMNEMANYFERSNVLQMEYEHDFAQRQQRIISRSISNEINTGNVSTRAKIVDMAPMIRDILRTERKRETTRRSSRNHYLKYFMPNNTNLNEYFDEQSKIFEKDS